MSFTISIRIQSTPKEKISKFVPSLPDLYPASFPSLSPHFSLPWLGSPTCSTIPRCHRGSQRRWHLIDYLKGGNHSDLRSKKKNNNKSLHVVTLLAWCFCFTGSFWRCGIEKKIKKENKTKQTCCFWWSFFHVILWKSIPWNVKIPTCHPPLGSH